MIRKSYEWDVHIELNSRLSRRVQVGPNCNLWLWWLEFREMEWGGDLDIDSNLIQEKSFSEMSNLSTQSEWKEIGERRWISGKQKTSQDPSLNTRYRIYFLSKVVHQLSKLIRHLLISYNELRKLVVKDSHLLIKDSYLVI